MSKIMQYNGYNDNKYYRVHLPNWLVRMKEWEAGQEIDFKIDEKGRVIVETVKEL